ncbi:MAG: Microtubule-nucleating Tub4p (gamma-tubulin) complex component [Geoglossum umbratile]|nr:MAG: Microtubule-nucleating Tub4p (gamma-tubulin) complex component [Geoglossum umbratile]
MSDDRERRIDDALSSLVDALIPRQHTDDDDDISDDRRENALDLVKGIIDGQVAPAVVSDVNHASDLIKKKLIRDGPSPDRALRFSNLYSRLLTQPVLSQKWAILYLLYQLADSNAPEPHARTAQLPSLAQEASQSNLGMAPPIAGASSLNAGTERVAGGAFADAFSHMGLHRLPEQGSRQRGRGEMDDVFNFGGNGKERSSSAKTKTGLLAQNHPPLNPPETSLLRDLPFTLQGLSSTNLPFVSISSLTLPPTLPPPIVSLLHTLAEPSLLYRGLSAFLQSLEGGLVGQSLRAALGEELRAYLGLVAALEGEIRCALAMADTNEPRGGIGKVAVTLKRCVIWTREATMGLRLMSLMVEKSKSKKGGQLISMIHGFSSSHGDPFVGAFAERLLMHVTRPFYDMLRQWIYDGELSDPHFEFFVLEQCSNIDTETNGDGRARGGATSVWEYKYQLDEEMIPSIITKDFAKKVFLIGKSLNFIRYGCGDSAWVEGYSKVASKELRYGDTATLETSIDEAYKATMARLIHLMADKFKLFEHLKALKKYLLLGQGDFIALLMENLSSNLDRPANTLYRHNLTAQLEHAIRGSNAQFDSSDVLRRLDARMLELSHGEIGWDVFTLEYKIDAPVDVVVTPYGGRQYLKVFNFLWRVKRVEFALGSTWRRYMTGARGVLASVADKVGADWKIARCCVAEMIHFVCQLQYYILFEVIESSWDALQVAMNKPECTLDDLIEAHAKYLQAITHKGLLGNARASGNTSKEEGFLAQLHEILKIMLAYKDAVDGLYSFSVAEFTRRQEATAKIETRTAQGKWGITEQDDEELSSPSPATMSRRGPGSESLNSTPFSGANNFGTGLSEDQMLPSLQQRLKYLSSDFRARVNILLGDLAYQPDVDMRFLGVVMNFNDVYNPIRRKTHKSGQRDKKATPKTGVSSGAAPRDSTA